MPARVSEKPKGRADYFKMGSNNCICDRSGIKMKSSEGRFEWNGLFVHKDYWEPRQPLDFLKGIPDDQTPDVSRPGGPDVFLTANEVTPSDL